MPSMPCHLRHALSALSITAPGLLYRYWCWGLPLACGISKGVKHEDGAIVFRNVLGGVLCLGPVLGLWWKGEACYMERKTTAEGPAETA